MNYSASTKRSRSLTCAQRATLGVLITMVGGIWGVLGYLVVTSGGLSSLLAEITGQPTSTPIVVGLAPLTGTSAPTTAPADIPSTPPPATEPTEPPNVMELTPDNAWQVWLAFLQYMRDYDIEGLDSLDTRDFTSEWEECLAGFGEDTCYGLIDFTLEVGSTIQRADLTIEWRDEQQLILRSEPTLESSVEEGQEMVCYNTAQVLFLRDSAGQISVVGYGQGSRCTNASPDAELRLQELLLDSDQDGATDEDETCANEYDPFCGPVTDPFNRDTDGDGYWDGIEVSAETDATDPTSRPG